MASTTIGKAAAIIRKGDIVAFPTETVYGLGANALDAKAVAKIFTAKGRPADNPIIVHVSDMKMLKSVVRNISPAARRLMKRFWPGPLTILFPKSERVPAIVTAGLSTVAVRMPNHKVALALIKSTGVPIAAPSANMSGRPSPTTAAHVRQDFLRLAIIDGGPTAHGLESTVVSVDGHPCVFRLGAITLEELREAVPDIAVAKHTAKRPASPGMKHKHYAPDKPLILFPLNKRKLLLRYAKYCDSPVILCSEKELRYFKEFLTVSLGKTDKEIAKNVFAALRTKKGKILLVLGVQKRGLGRAVMDRLERAASKKF